MAVINNNCYRLIVNSQVKCYLKGHFTQNVNSVIYNLHGTAKKLSCTAFENKEQRHLVDIDIGWIMTVPLTAK